MHFPNSFVFGIENSHRAGDGHKCKHGQEDSNEPVVLRNYLLWIQSLSLPNCAIAMEILNYERIADLQAGGFFADVMFLLGAFHHIDIASVDQYKNGGFLAHIDGTVNLMAKM